MAEVAKIPNYQVKVDNWSIFFLQRLHHFYKKDYHCDLTLVFSTVNTVKSVKVHKLVLHACTDYFDTLEVKDDSEFGQCLQLSDEMHPDVIIPIISFMYTGKLEFPASLQSRLYEAAIKLRMTILTKLLDAQPKQAGQPSSATPAEGFSKSPKLKGSPTDDHSQDSQPQGMHVMQILSNFSEPTPSKQVEEPIVTLTPLSSTHSQRVLIKSDSIGNSKSTSFDALKASTAGTTVLKTKAFRKYPPTGGTASKAKVVDVTLPPTLPGRKLPIWKRKVPYTGPQVSSENSVDLPERFCEVPKPTRFEWDEDLNDLTSSRPVEEALRALSHDGTTRIQYPMFLDGETAPPRQKETSTSTNINANTNTSISTSTSTSSNDLKRSSPSSPGSPESPPFKRSKADLQAMKEYGRQQQLRNKIICNEENSEDGMDPDDIYGSCDEESQDFPGSQSGINSSTPKPILKCMGKPECSQPASKKVRFSFGGKENNKKPNDSPLLAKKPGAVLTKQKIVLPMNVNQMRSGGHHVKIVSEVLKKYPNLTKRDNVKLKVVSKIPAAVPPTVQHAVEGDSSGNKSATSHVSYIYLMNENPNQSSNVQAVGDKDEKLFDVENRIGPWFCTSCGTSSEPIEFESYFHYRRHLVDIHGLKIDARICEYCGLKSSKRNHLLYHLYTKHSIAPPPHVSFPKCSDCNYIALSDALLIKHKAVHESKDLLTCYICNVSFKTFSQMQIHLQSECHKKRFEGATMALPNYPCPFCENQFVNGGDLKDHIEESHQSQLQYSEGNEGNQQLDSAGSGESQESTDLEPTNNVAPGVVSSLNLVGNEQAAVMYYEQQAGHQDIGREATVMTGEECKDFIIPGSAEDIEPGNAYQRTDQQNDDVISVENEDSNSIAEEVNPTTCSDHDYSEPQTEDTVRQVIPLQQVADNFQGAQIIQQILPEQQLVFTPSQPTVLYQSSRLNLPQRLLLTTSGNMVLSQISHAGQNVILPQVIPQARIILSNQIIQQPGNIIQPNPGSTIVFTSPQVHSHEVDNVESLDYPNMAAGTDSVKDQNAKNDIMLVDDNDVILPEGLNIGNLNVPGINDEGINDHEMNEQGMNIGNLNEQDINEQEMNEQGMNIENMNEQDLDDRDLAEQGITEQGLTEQGITEQGIAEQDTTEHDTTEQDIPEQDMDLDEQDIPEQDIDEQDISEQDIPEQDIPEQDMPEQDIPEQDMPEQDIPEQDMPEQDIPEQDIDEQDIVEQEETCDKNVERPLSLDDLMEPSDKKEEKEDDEESSSILQNRPKQKPSMSRGESAKIVDDWDETNETVQNVESRKDGPSRPDFF